MSDGKCIAKCDTKKLYSSTEDDRKQRTPVVIGLINSTAAVFVPKRAKEVTCYKIPFGDVVSRMMVLQLRRVLTAKGFPDVGDLETDQKEACDEVLSEEEVKRPDYIHLKNLFGQLPSIITAQHQKERNAVSRGVHLVHSAYFQSLLALGCLVGMDGPGVNLELLKCSFWSSFRDYCAVVRTGYCLTSPTVRAPARDLQMLLHERMDPFFDEEENEDESEKPVGWRYEQDVELMRWANESSEWFNGGPRTTFMWGNGAAWQLVCCAFCSRQFQWKTMTLKGITAHKKINWIFCAAHPSEHSLEILSAWAN